MNSFSERIMRSMMIFSKIIYSFYLNTPMNSIPKANTPKIAGLKLLFTCSLSQNGIILGFKGVFLLIIYI